MKAIALLVPVLSAAYVSAHGILTEFTVNGKPVQDVIRQVSSQDPNRGADNPALTCGPNARPAPKVAEVMPGDALTFDWRTASGSPWPHNTGPLMTYLADCGSVSCDKFDASQAKWFKIDQVSRKGNSGNWFQGDLMSGAPASVKLPSNLASGNYLIRHEVLSLHLAQTPRMAEFYPGCVQVHVGGSGTGRPLPTEAVSLPGNYQDTDPGILTPNIFDAGAKYTPPGPDVAAFVSGGASGPAPVAGSDGKNGTSSAVPDPVPTPTKDTPAAPVKTGKSGSCKLKKGSKKSSSTSAAAAPAATTPAGDKTNNDDNKTGSDYNYKKRSPVDADTLSADNVIRYAPRHISRVMRSLAFHLSH